MKKLLALLLTSIIILTGCGSTNYDDPQIYVDAVVDSAKKQGNAIESLNEYLKLIEVEENANNALTAYTDLIGAILSSYDGDKEALYNDFVAEMQEADFSSMEEDLQEAISTYNESGEFVQNATTTITNASLNVITLTFNTMVTIVESDEFQAILDAADSVEDIVNGLEDQYSETEDLDLDSLLGDLDI